jgi:hypothetical protein
MTTEEWIAEAAELYVQIYAMGPRAGRALAGKLYETMSHRDPLGAVAWDVHENPTPLIDPDELGAMDAAD